MGFGRDAGRRRQAAQQHARNVHTCPRCGRKIRGNAYYRHKNACLYKYEGPAGLARIANERIDKAVGHAASNDGESDG